VRGQIRLERAVDVAAIAPIRLNYVVKMGETNARVHFHAMDDSSATGQFVGNPLPPANAYERATVKEVLRILVEKNGSYRKSGSHCPSANFG
jgi:hypothetical protein